MSSDNDNLLALFDAVLNDRADEEQIRRLDTLLAEDPEVVELYVLYSQQEVDLRHALKTDCVYAGDLGGAPAALSRATSTQSRRPRSNRLLTAIMACAATLLVAVGSLYLFNREAPPADNIVDQSLPTNPTAATTKEQLDFGDLLFSRTPAPVAVLTAESDAIWQGPKIFLGQSLREGDAVTLVRGDIRISMGFGAEIAAKGPCALRLVARDRVQLESGEVAVHVADWAHGFTVETPAMDVVDLGTTFVVSASPDDSAEASVIKGQIRVSPRKKIGTGPRSVLVSAGEALMVESTGRRKSFESTPDDTIDFGVEQPFRPIGLHNTGYGFAVGDEDPHWRVVKGPDEVFKGPQYAMVCVPDERYMANDPGSSQWVSMANWREAPPNSKSTFQTTFDLTGFDLSTVQLFGRFLADNGIKEVRVNGQTVMLESWVDNTPGQRFDQPQFRTVNVSEGLVEGVNTIEMDVWNGVMGPIATHGTMPNPMALRVEWEGFGRPKQLEKSEAAVEKVTPAPATKAVSKRIKEPFGLHNTGAGFAVGARDPYWQVIKGPEGEFEKPQDTIICVADDRYLANDPDSSQWISMANWRETPPKSQFTFQTMFDLKGYDLATVKLFGRFLADNGIKEVRLNGQTVMRETLPEDTSGQSFDESQFRTVNLTEGLVEGVNTIELDVWNGVMGNASTRDKLPNPMALRVEWEGFGQRKQVAKSEATADITSAATATSIASDR